MPPLRLFHPECEGFAFPNSWLLTQQEMGVLTGVLNGIIPTVAFNPLVVGTITPLLGPAAPFYPLIVPAALGASIGIAITNWYYGLCGGMAFAALDYWKQGWVIQRGFPGPPPTNPCPEAQGLRSYIWQRLIDSFTSGVLPRTLEWMLVRSFGNTWNGSGDASLRARSTTEWSTLRAHLDGGQPWPLALIRATDNPTVNHQVLAYGYDLPATDRVTIYVYDNNHPDSEQTLSLTLSGGQIVGLAESGQTSMALCGFFCSNYTPSIPPAALGLTAGLTAAPVGNVVVNDRVHVTFTTRNYGYGASPSVRPSVSVERWTGVDPHAALHLIAAQVALPIDSPVTAAGAPSGAPNVTCRPVVDPELRPDEVGTWSFSPELVLTTAQNQLLYKRVPAHDAGTRDRIAIAVTATAADPTTHAAIWPSADGRLDTFAVGTSGVLSHLAQTANGGAWSGWTSHGGALVGSPALGRGGTKCDLMVVARDGTLQHIWQTAPDGGWSSWYSHGGALIGSPALAQHVDGALEVFATGRDGAIYTKRQNGPNAGWSGWSSLGGAFASAPAAGRGGSADLVELMAVGTDGHLRHAWQTGAGWSAWYDHGGAFAGPPAIARRGGDGALKVVVIGKDGQLQLKLQGSPNGGWSDWQSLGGALAGAPAMAASGELVEIMAVGTDGHLYHRWETSAGGAWSPWFDHGGLFIGSPALGRRLDGGLEVFVSGLDGNVWHKRQPAANAAWSTWTSRGPLL